MDSDGKLSYLKEKLETNISERKALLTSIQITRQEIADHCSPFKVYERIVDNEENRAIVSGIFYIDKKPYFRATIRFAKRGENGHYITDSYFTKSSEMDMSLNWVKI